MAISTGGGGDTPMSDINTTPLVEVMLVLLIIFLITAGVRRRLHVFSLAFLSAAHSEVDVLVLMARLLGVKEPLSLIDVENVKGLSPRVDDQVL